MSALDGKAFNRRERREQPEYAEKSTFKKMQWRNQAALHEFKIFRLKNFSATFAGSLRSLRLKAFAFQRRNKTTESDDPNNGKFAPWRRFNIIYIRNSLVC